MTYIKTIAFCLTFFCAAWINPAFALAYPLPTNGDNVIGEVQYIESLPGDTFSRVARRYNIGYYQLVEANPDVDPDQIETGTRLVIPTAFVLPATPRKGVVINLAELRMYYYPPDGKTVITYPLGIGREGWNTPLGVTHITEKTKNPTWIPPKSIRDFRKKEGVDLPAKVLPGVENPLGGYRMRLAIGSGTYLIHGTNDATGVGRRSSSGCIRMLPEDVEALYEKVPSGTKVLVINEPYKVGWSQGKLFLEAHLPLEEQTYKYARTLTPMLNVVKAAKGTHNAQINWDLANRIAVSQNGIPTQIGVAESAEVSEESTVDNSLPN